MHIFHKVATLGLSMLLLCACFVSAASAEEAAREVVSIEVQGNRYVERAAILERVRSKVGEPLSRKQISRDVRKLFATGFFADVHVEGVSADGGVRLVYVVKENPVIAELNILGNDEIVDKDLRPKLKLKPGRVYSEDLLRRDKTRIRKAYLKKGYYQVDVQEETRLLDDGRLHVTLNISEGQVTRIKQIRFIGNQAFSDEQLRDQLASRESDFASWISDKDVFDRERFGADSQLLQRYYLNRGYLDMAVESTRLALTPDKSSFYLTFVLHEGIRYTVDKLEVQGDLVPSKEALLETIKLESGEYYSLEKLQQSISGMTDKVGDEGYAFANITPLFKRDVASQSVSLAFDVEKGREVYVERIDISGNEKSEDKVVRREIRQAEGARYKASDVTRSRERLNRTQLFDDVRISLPKGDTADKVRMKVEVSEKKSGSFSAGAGYSQVEKVFFTAKLEENNFLGKGYVGSLKADIGGATQNFTTTLSDNYFLDSDVGASLTAYKTDTRLQTYTSYRQNSYGGGVGFSIPITEYLRYSIGYRYDNSTLTDIAANSSLVLLAQAGRQTTGEVTQTVAWDTRNRSMAPTAGHIEQLKVGVAGVGGANRFLEVDASSSSFFSLDGNYILNPMVSGKYIRGISGHDVPIYRRYSIGGAGSLRGFDSYGVSLRDPQTGDVIGGDKQLTASLNLFFPIPYVETPGIRGVVFADAGLVWGSVDVVVGARRLSATSQLTGNNVRSSAGLGLEWLSPVGPVAFIWGFPIRSQPGDIERSFEFALGMGF